MSMMVQITRIVKTAPIPYLIRRPGCWAADADRFLPCRQGFLVQRPTGYLSNKRFLLRGHTCGVLFIRWGRRLWNRR